MVLYPVVITSTELLVNLFKKEYILHNALYNVEQDLNHDLFSYSRLPYSLSILFIA